MAKKHKKAASKASEPLDLGKVDYGQPESHDEEVPDVEPDNKASWPCFSTNWYDNASAASLDPPVDEELPEASFDEELPEVGKPDTAHDREPVEQKRSVHNMSSRSSDTFDVGKTSSLGCSPLAMLVLTFSDTPQASQSESVTENPMTLNEDSNLDTLQW